jgi:hypothetical protein
VAHLSELQRSNPNGWVTWLAHRTVFGGAPDCPVRPSTDNLPNDHFGGWGYKYPPTTTLQDIQVFSHCIQYKISRLHSKTKTRDQILSQVHNHSKHLVTSEREIFVFIEFLSFGSLFFFLHSCSQATCNQARDTKLWWSL